MRISVKLIALSLAILPTAACQQVLKPPVAEAPKAVTVTPSAELLQSIPPAKINTVVSVYNFDDQTGQLKSNDQYAEYSRAVTQGGLPILSKALYLAANGQWFTVVERGGLKNLLQERQIIRTMRDQYEEPDGKHLGNLPPLLYAGLLIEGGVVGYDTNIITGGVGANFLGIGGDVKYRRDIVTVDLRAVSVATGQVVVSVTSEKTVYSAGLSGSIFKYVSFNKLLQAETGFTVNEPTQLAVRQAIEAAVYSLVMEGALRQLWEFADEAEGRKALAEYIEGLKEGQSSEALLMKDMPPEMLQPVDAQIEEKRGTELPTKADAEKQTIVKETNDFLSTGEEGNAPAPGMDYPVIPLPPPKR